MPYQAGSAYVSVQPSFAGAQETISRAMQDLGGRGGDDFAAAWEANAAPKIQAALDNLPEVEIKADSSDADRALADIRSELETLGAAHVGVDIDAAEATARLDDLRERLATLAREHPDVTAGADVSQAMAELDALAAVADEVGAKSPTVKADADTAGATAQLASLSSVCNDIAGRGATIGAGIVAGLAAIIPVAGAALAALTAVAQAAAGLGAGLGVAALAISPVVKAMQAQDAANQSAAKSAGSAGEAEQAKADKIQSASERVQDAERSVAQAREDAARGARDAAERVSDAQDKVTQAEQDAASRVADAQRSLSDAREAASRASQQAAERVQQAAERVADAEQQAARQVEDAQRRVVDAREQATRAVAQAEQAAADAGRQLVSAQQAEADAQAKVTQARRDARAALDDLNAALREGVTSQESAQLAVKDAAAAQQNLGPSTLEVAQAQATLADAQRKAAADSSMANQLAVQEAQQRLAALKASIGGTDEEREKARIAYDQAVERLDAIKRRNAELQQQKTEADRAGVDGSQKVQAAVKGVADAHESVLSAQRQVSERTDAIRRAQVDGARQVQDAERALSDAQLSGVREVADARRALSDAQRSQQDAQRQGAERVEAAERSVAKAQTDGARSVQAAHEALARAQQAQSDQAVKGARQVEDAQRRLIRAQQDLAKAQRDTGSAGGGASGGMSKLNEAMAKLTPAGRDFLGLLQRMKGGLDTLSRTAQSTMLPGLQRALESLAPAFGPVNTLVGNLGRTLGKLAEDGAAQLRGPFWTQFGKLLAQDLPVWLDKGARIIGNFATALAGGFKAMLPAGTDFLTMLQKWSGELATSSKSLDKNDGFQRFLAYVRENTPKVMTTLRDLMGAVSNVVKGLAPLGPVVLDLVDKFAKWVASLDPKTIQSWATGFVGVVTALKGFGIFGGIIDNVGKFKRAYDSIFKGSGGGPGGPVKAVVTEFQKFSKEMQGLYNFAVKLKTGLVFDNVLSKLRTGFAAAEKAISWAKNLGPVVGWLGKLKDAFNIASTVQKLASTVSSVGSAVKTLGPLLMTPPLGIVVAVAAVGAAVVIAYNKFKPFHDAVDKLGGVIKSAAEAAGRFVVSLKDKVVGGLNAAVDWIKKHWQDVLLGILTGPFAPIIKAIASHWDDIKKKVSDGVGAAVDWIKKHWQDVLLGVLTGPFAPIIKAIVSHWDDIKKKVSDGAGAVKKFITDAINGWKNIFTRDLPKLASAIWDNVKTWPGKIQDGARQVVSKIGDAIRDWTKPIRDWNLAATFKSIWDGATKVVSDAIAGIMRFIQPLLDKIEAVKNGISKIPGAGLLGLADGGPVPDVPGFAAGGSTGGLLPGQPPANGRDNLAAHVVSGTRAMGIRVMSGEYIQPVARVQQYGLHVMEAMRRGLLPAAPLRAMAAGVSPDMAMRTSFAAGGQALVPSYAGVARATAPGAAGTTAPVVAVLDPAAAKLIAATASRPVTVRVGERQLFAALTDAQRRYSDR